MPRTPPPPFGLALTILRTAVGWTQKELSEATGLSRVLISEYETGATELTRDRLEFLAAAMGWPPGSVDRTLFGLGLLPLPSNAPVSLSFVEPNQEERWIIDQAVALAARDAAEELRAELIRELRQEKIREARRAAAALWLRLKPLPGSERRRLVAQEPEFQHPFLVERLCLESVRVAGSDAGRAREPAEVALLVAEHVVGPPAWRSRLQGYAWAFIGNARRVANNLPAADSAFSRAWVLWREGASADQGLLEESRLLDLEASLRRDQRRFGEALNLHERALVSAKPETLGYFLLNKSSTLEQSGEFERSIETLEQATQSVNIDQPRLLWVLRFNQAVNLAHVGRLTEAEDHLAEARELAIRLGNELDLVRVFWLEGRIAAGCKDQGKATAIFEQVRREFTVRRMAYDFALVSLELAALYREQERMGEVKNLAQQMVWIFKAQGVHREALSALHLFRESAEKEELTVEMVRRLIAYLMKARYDPQLRFEA